jgi:transposase
MFPISSTLQFYLYSQPTDMRKGFDGLSGLVISGMKRNPLSGDVYLFINRRRDRMKLLIWDRTGYWILYKRLEKGRFQLAANHYSQGDSALSYDSIIMLLEGIDLRQIKRRKRYIMPANNIA